MVFFARHTATAFDRKLEWRYIFCTAAAPLASGTLKGSRSGFGFGPDLVLAHFLQLTSGKWPLLPTHFYKVRGTLKKSDFVPTRGWGVWPNPNFLKPQPYMAQLLCWNTANIYDLLKCFFFSWKIFAVFSFQFSLPLFISANMFGNSESHWQIVSTEKYRLPKSECAYLVRVENSSFCCKGRRWALENSRSSSWNFFAHFRQGLDVWPPSQAPKGASNRGVSRAWP